MHDNDNVAELIDTAARWAYGRCHREPLQPADRDDVLQDVRVMLWESMRRYDPARGTEFSYLVTVARRWMFKILMRRHSRSMRFQRMAQVERIDPAAPARRRNRYKLPRTVRRAFRRMQPHELEALRAHYLDGKTYREIGEGRGTSKQGAFALCEQSLKNLRRLIQVGR